MRTGAPARRDARVVVSTGDPAGVGPELLVAALSDERVCGLADFIVTGDPDLLLGLARDAGTDLCAEIVPAGSTAGTRPGTISAESGAAAVASATAAVELMLAGEGDALVTGPVAKEGLRLAGKPWPGQTEMLAALTGVEDLRVMLSSDRLRVAHVSTHLPLARALEAVTADAVTRTIELARGAVCMLGVEQPRVGVCGVNPHAGERGLLGVEDERDIAPAVAAARAQGVDAHGPLSADTLFPAAFAGEYDVVIAMYHDQGHIPVKLIAGEQAVAMTLGLPFPRTSPDHGAAPAIARTGRARADSFVEALRLAAACAESRA